MTPLGLIGNEVIQKQIMIALTAADFRNGAIPHMLFSGVPGCGKTSTARALSKKAEYNMLQVPPEEFKSYSKIVDILSNLNYDGYSRYGDKISKVKPTILFIDEIHRLPILGQEKLGIIMEDYRIESERDKGRYVWFPLFTVIGATTEEGLLSKPFRERFKLVFQFNPYSIEDTEEIVKYHSERLQVPMTKKAIRETARRAKGIPRITVTYVELLRDRKIAVGSEIVTSKIVQDLFDDLGIDEFGLNKQERNILLILNEAKSPIGISNLATMVNCSQATIADSSEPFLLREGLIARTSRGRTITNKGKEYVKKYILLNNEGNENEKEDIEATYVRQL